MGWSDPFPQVPYGDRPLSVNDPLSPKAWCKFNGTGSVALDASENVSSVTDNGTGNYTVNYTEPFSSADYAVVVTGSLNGGSPTYANVISKAAGSAGLRMFWDSGTGATYTLVDLNDVSFVAFGDQ